MDWLDKVQIYFVDLGKTSGRTGNFLYDYQSLIAGLFALAVGIITIVLLNIQIQSERKRRAVEDRRRHRAVRAGLNFSFVELLEYAEHCFQFMVSWLSNWDEFDEWDKDSELSWRTAPPELPFEALRNVQFAIETAPEPIASSLERIITSTQIQNSRFTELNNQLGAHTRDTSLVVSKSNVHNAASNALELRFLFSAGLRYARNETQSLSSLPDHRAAEEFLFFVPYRVEDELREFISNHWGELYRSYEKLKEETPPRT